MMKKGFYFAKYGTCYICDQNFKFGRYYHSTFKTSFNEEDYNTETICWKCWLSAKISHYFYNTLANLKNTRIVIGIFCKNLIKGKIRNLDDAKLYTWQLWKLLHN